MFRFHTFGYLFIALCFSCTKDKTSFKNNPVAQTCDSTNIRYSSCVLPILESRCYACHSDSASQNGSVAFDIQNFEDLKTYLTYFYRGDSIYGSKFYHIIEQAPLVLSLPPAPANKLSNTDIATIGQWINEGAINK